MADNQEEPAEPEPECKDTQRIRNDEGEKNSDKPDERRFRFTDWVLI